MFIKSLHLENFRSHAESNFELDRLTVFTGKNGAGKTSLLHALQLALTGRAEPITDAKGAGGDALIRLGAKSLEIGVEFIVNGAPGLLRYQRTSAGAAHFAGNASGRNAIAVIEKNIAPLPVLSAVLDCNRFLEMTQAEQRDLLAKALASDPVKLQEHELLKGHMSQVTSAAEVEDLYKHFYDRRRETNAEIKAMGEVVMPERPADLPEIENVDALIRSMQKDRDAKVKQRAEQKADFERAMNAYEAAVAQKQLLDKDVLSNEELEKQRGIAGNAAASKKLDAQIREYEQTITAAEGGIAAENNKIAAIEDHCPTCKQFIANAGELRQEMRKEIERLEGSLATAKKELAGLKEKREALGDPMAANEKIERHGKAGMAWGRADAIVQQGIPVQASTDELDAAIAQYDKLLEDTRGIERRIAEYEAQVRVYEQKLERKKKLGLASAQLDQMCEYFGPKSKLRDQLVGDKLGPFVERINRVLARFGFSCEIELNPYSLLVQLHDDGRMLRIAQLSESEQFRFSVAFNVALAEATGVGLAVIDRIDMLTADLEKAMLSELFKSDLDQVICLGTEVPRPKTLPPGMAYFELVNEDGTTRELTTEVAGVSQ